MGGGSVGIVVWKEISGLRADRAFVTKWLKSCRRWCSKTDHPECRQPSGIQMAAVWPSGRYSDSRINHPLGLDKRCDWKTRSLEELGHSCDELGLDGIVKGCWTKPRKGCLINVRNCK